jgi:FxsC-like protein
VEPLGPGAGSDAPYFFLSYAHVPSPDGEDAGESNLWIEKLFNDLRRRVAEQAKLRDLPSSIGFMDTGIRHGIEWSTELSGQLAACRTFVPLYSARYFLSEACGREWSSFCLRVRNLHAQGSGHIRQIIPVQWIPVPLDQRPEEARRIQFRPEDLGPKYARHGFYPLTHVDEYKDAYNYALYHLAAQIVAIAEQEPAPPGPALHFESQPNAFAGGAPLELSQEKPFHIILAAPHRGNLPPERKPDCYGATPYEWNPFTPAMVEPLAQYAQRVALREGHRRPQVYALLDYEEELLRNPAYRPKAPAVLLIDPWVLTDPESCRVLKAYDRLVKPWIQPVIAWNVRDSGLIKDEEMLRNLIGKTLPNKIARSGRPAQQVATLGVPTLDEMTSVLPDMIRTAKRHFIRQWPSQRDGGGQS